MLRALMEMNEIVGQYCFPTGIVYADKTREDPTTRDYKRLAYLNYATLNWTPTANATWLSMSQPKQQQFKP
jgi:hypothetical protein